MDKVGCERICRNHSARTERDQYRVCPTKLSKCELEDLYFALLEQNLQLKKSVNGQQDRIKVLSTKMQRMASAQKSLRAEENKNCCVATKAVVNQQKDIIADLKLSNERMADRIRKLNMRLCSAKQFCKSATPRGLRCSTATSPYLIKHSTCSYKQQSHSTLKLAVSCHNLSRETLLTKSIQTDPCESPKLKEEKKLCDDNKCKTTIDELKEKIANLEEIVSRTRAECSSLEASLADAREAAARACAQGVAAERDLNISEQRNTSLTTSLRAAEGLSGELKTQLSIEKRKVAELETRLKAAAMSSQVTKTIEDTLSSIQESNKSGVSDVAITCSCCSPRSKTESSVQQTITGLSPGHANLSKSIEDSGFMDSNKSQNFMDDQSLNKIIEELTKRIVVLQTQVDALTISPPETNTTATRVNSPVAKQLNTLSESDSTHTTAKMDHHTSPKPTPEKTTIIQNAVEKPKTENTDETKIVIPEKDCLQVPGHKNVTESSQTVNWKKHITVVKTTKDKDSTDKETAQTKESNAKDNKKVDNNKDKDDVSNTNSSLEITNNSKELTIDIPNENKEEVIKETTSSPEDKTYNKSERDKKIVKENILSEKDKTATKNDTNIVEKEKTSPKKDKKDLYEKVKKAISKEKVKNNSEKDNDIGGQSKEGEQRGAVSKTIQNTERKSRLGRFDTIGRADTYARAVSSSSSATYTVRGEESRNSSPDNTDYDVSSMTDLTDERDLRSPSRGVLSPGEHKFPVHSVTHSDSLPTTNYSLSEGEVLLNTVRRRSYDDKPRAPTGPKATVPKMEETLQAITDELARCKRLLFSQRSRDNTMSALM